MNQLKNLKRLAAKNSLQELIILLYEQAALRGHNDFELARQLGMTFGELHYLVNNAEEFSKLNALRMRVIAQYLGISTIMVWILARKLEISDLTISGQSSVAIATGLESIMKDDSVSAFLPLQVLDAPVSVQAILCNLHQKLIEESAQLTAMESLTQSAKAALKEAV